MSDVIRNSIEKNTYPNGENFLIDDTGKKIYGVMDRTVRNVRFKKTGERRAPKKGEWYLSGAEPHAYMAPNDLSTEYHILVKA
jgi:hypothetical protein